MIIVKLTAGLGNQMFQYAAGRSLAFCHNTTLKLDISSYKQQCLRNYDLQHFNIIEEFATPNEIFSFSGRPQTHLQKMLYFPTRIWCGLRKRVPIARRILRKNAEVQGKCAAIQPHLVYEEPHFHFDDRFFSLPEDVYLKGCWQSEKYFIGIKEIIRDELTVKTPLKDRNLEIAKKIEDTESVSIHIRRGDYVANLHTYEYHGTCDLDYYDRCIRRIAKEVSNPYFYLFSDDPQWARENLKVPYPLTIIEHNGPEASYEDLRLMRLCKHNIIANSSFSWWAAWLNRNPLKLVFAPRKWFNNAQLNTRDIYPNGWNLQ